MIHIVSKENQQIFEAEMKTMFAERKLVFIDLLKWPLPVTDGCYEIDDFDTPDAVYFIASHVDGSHLGSLRLLRTDRPHILGELFPHLADGAVPTGPDTLEITRLCLSPRLRASERRLVRNQLISAMTDYALAHGIRTLTGVARTSWLAQIQMMGWLCETLGAPQNIDGTMTGAFRIAIEPSTPGDLARLNVYVPQSSRFFTAHTERKQSARTSNSAEMWAPRLLEDGYCIVPDAASPEMLQGLNTDLEARFQATPFCEGGFYGPRTKRFGSLLTQGARLIGTYDSVVAFGQSRALLVWQRIIMPDGSSVVIDNLPATDTAGYAGLEDEVDFHTWQLLKGVALSTLLGTGTQVTFGNSQSNLVQAIRQSTQESTNEAGQRLVEKTMNIQPTITVRPGWPLRVIIHKDLVLAPYRAGSQGG